MTINQAHNDNTDRVQYYLNAVKSDKRINILQELKLKLIQSSKHKVDLISYELEIDKHSKNAIFAIDVKIKNRIDELRKYYEISESDLL